MPRSATPIPTAPLMTYIRKHGGVENLPEILDLGVLVPCESTHGHVRVLSEHDRLRVDRIRKLLRRAVMSGHVDLYMADALCCDDLGVHPVQIWGMDWFDFHPSEPTRMSELRVPGEPMVLGVAA